MWYWQENRQIVKQNREPSNRSTQNFIQLNIFIEIKKEKLPQWSKDSLLQIVQEELDIHMQKKKKKKNLQTDLTFFTEINSKWFIGLNVKCKTMKLLKYNRGQNLGR